ncbi:hypothetical protein T11_9915 [Trichinella zimbabwensis]|uniref:Uncharacterized protein n=1 Tax=Trichinella zimbabwensis TaxID=268475 RepID=A0A0V1HH36_9BILA|nr:hypothetical protein T11_9915 [Trichinella zimbabwensis]
MTATNHLYNTDNSSLDAKTESLILLTLLGVFCEWMLDFMEERNCQDPLSLNSCEQWTDGRSDG